jgi:hypothetical protein
LQLEKNSDPKNDIAKDEIERKIRMCKMYKNRTEKIKIDRLAESFRIKKSAEKANNSPSPRPKLMRTIR